MFNEESRCSRSHPGFPALRAFNSGGQQEAAPPPVTHFCLPLGWNQTIQRVSACPRGPNATLCGGILQNLLPSCSFFPSRCLSAADREAVHPSKDAVHPPPMRAGLHRVAVSPPPAPQSRSPSRAVGSSLDLRVLPAPPSTCSSTQLGCT